jgi:hypothetical protein
VISRPRKSRSAIAALSLLTGVAFADPCDYSSPGEPLWQEIANRYDAGDARTFPFYVLTDGVNLCVISQVYVAAMEGGGANPIKLVTPSAETIQNSGKLNLLSPEAFIAANASHVNRVTKSNPVRPGMLNVYVTNVGNLCSSVSMGD